MEVFVPVSDTFIEHLRELRPVGFEIDERADGLILKKGWSLILEGDQLYYAGKLLAKVETVGIEESPLDFPKKLTHFNK